MNKYRGENPSSRNPARFAKAIDRPFPGWIFASTRCSPSAPNASASTSASPRAITPCPPNPG